MARCLNPNCKVGEITQGQYGAEGDDAFKARLASGYCRPKCKRLAVPSKPPHTSPPLGSPLSANYGGGGRAVPKEKVARDKNFLLFVISGECELRGGRFGMCHGDLIYHHTEGGGVALKGSDYSAICVCHVHHLLFDNASKKGKGIFTPDELQGIIERNKQGYVIQGGIVK